MRIRVKVEAVAVDDLLSLSIRMCRAYLVLVPSVCWNERYFERHYAYGTCISIDFKYKVP